MWLGLGMLCRGGMWEAGGPVSHLCYCAIWVFSHSVTLAHSGSCVSWLVLTEKKHVSPGLDLDKLCPRFTVSG